MVTVFTDNPRQLLTDIKLAIADGRIDTWAVDKDGDFTHSRPQWQYKAWLRPKIGEGVLTFIIMAPKNEKMSKEVYAIYHGRFIEALLAHFDTKFASASASAIASVRDLL